MKCNIRREFRIASVVTGATIRTKRQRCELWLHHAQRGLLGALALILSMAVLAGCGGSAPGATASTAADSVAKAAQQTQRVSVDSSSYTNVSPTGLASMLKAKDFPLINVHVPYEGEIEGTDHFIPYTDIQNNLSKLPADKSAKIFLYCRSGNMSDIAARTLVKLGYTNVLNLDGGMIAWKQAGYQVAEKAR